MTAELPQPSPSEDATTAASGPRALEVSHLHKTYGRTVAVEDVSFVVAEGQIFGLLGPNGAGKTTTVECAVGLRAPDAGSVQVLGLDPVHDRERLRLVVGIQLQSSTLPDKMKVKELLELYSSFYTDPADTAELAEALGIADKRDAYYRSLSGGQKQRLSVALALVGRPKVAVLDEMTTGLDPHARRDTWELVERIRDRGVTVLLVTHYMEEAERLCDRVALLDRGQVVATGTPAELAQRAARTKRVSFVASAPFEDRALSELPGVSMVKHHGPRVEVSGSGDLANAVILRLAAAGVTAHDLQLTSASLEDAFVQLTGRHLSPAPRTEPPRRQQERQAMRARRPRVAKGAPPRAFAKLVQSEARVAWRRPVGLLTGFGLPVLLLLLFGSIPSFTEHSKTFGGLSYFDVSIPILMVFVLAALALFSLPTALATYREQGILRRLSTTPCPPSWALGAQLVVTSSIAVAALVLLMVVGTAGFGVKTPESLGGFVLSVGLSGVAVFAIGLLIAGAAPTAAAAGGIAWLSFYPLTFFSGLFVPLQVLSAGLRRVAEWTPLGAAVDALQRSMQNGFPSWSSLAVLAAYAVVFAGLAVRFFRWE